MDSMIWLLLSLVSAITFAILGRSMARKKHRGQLQWGLAGAVFPPLLLVLLFLKRHDSDATESA